MKKKLSIVIAIVFSVYTYSQNLFVVKRVSEPTGVTVSLQKINSSDGTAISSSYYTTLYTPEYLTFNPQTNEIFGFASNRIFKKNIITNVESSFMIPAFYQFPYAESSRVFDEIIIANNRLFIKGRVFVGNQHLGPSNSLYEIDQSTGSLISEISLGNERYRRVGEKMALSFSSLTNEIYGLDFTFRIIYKMNILTNRWSFLQLPYDDYSDLIIAGNRLFVTQYIAGNVFKILELNKNDGSIINSHTFATDLSGYDKIESLTFLADTHEICGTMRRLNNYTDLKIIKYNILNSNESSFDLIGSSSIGSFGRIVSTTIEELSTSGNIESNRLALFPNPTSGVIAVQNNINSTINFDYKIFDLMGRIVKSGNSTFNEQMNIADLKSGNYIIQIETQDGEKTTEKLIKI